MKSRIYLSGPRGGCSEVEVNGWRDQIIQACPWLEYFDPRKIDASNTPPNEIVDIDTAHIMRSDVVVFNIWKASPGTLGELALSSFFGKENLIIVPDSNLARHPWIISAGIEYDSVEEVIDHLTLLAKRDLLVL